MFKHLLAPLDFSEKNAAALEIVHSVARQNDARLTLIHVIERVEQEDDDELTAFYESLEDKAQAQLDAAAQRFVDAGVQVAREVVFGRRGPEIVRFAMEQDVDLVVLSSRRIDLSQPVEGLTSVSHQVSIFCQCPVLLVK